MTTKRKFVLVLLLALLGACALAAPFALPAGALYWARSRAWSKLKNLTPEERRILNSTPTRIELPSFQSDAQPVETVEIDGYRVRVVKPESREDRGHVVILKYSRFRVLIWNLASTSASDAAARQLHFKDDYDLLWATNHLRLDDLNSQPDLPSLRQFLLLIPSKPGRMACTEEFERTDMRGFIMAPLEHRTLTIVDFPKLHAACGVHFEDHGGLTLSDVHTYLAILRVERKPPTTTAATTTTAPSESPDRAP
jgi:hypothetical protein